MANTLQKVVDLTSIIGTEDIPAVPYRPAIPRRVTRETRLVCGLRYPPGTVTYEYRYDYTSNKVILVATPLPGQGSAVGTYSCQVEEVDVVYPAVPAQAAVPGRTRTFRQTGLDYHLGFNSGARSIESFTGSGSVSFYVTPLDPTGVIAGLNLIDSVTGYPGSNIDYAFQLDRAGWKILEKGIRPFESPSGSYGYLTEFKIERTPTQIKYWFGGSNVWNTPVGANYATPAYLEASLFAGGDRINNPALVQGALPTPSFAVSFDLVLPRPTAQLRENDAEFNLFMGELLGDLVAGVPEPATTTISLFIPPLAFGMTAAVSSCVIEMQLPPLSLFMSQNGGADLYVPLPKPTIQDWDVGSEVVGFLADAFAFRVLMLAEVGEVGVEPEPEPPEVGEGRDKFYLSVPMTGDFDQTVDARDSFAFGVFMAVRDQGGEVTVLNVAEGGSTFYHGYEFNSFAEIGGQYFGANSKGVFVLDGATDAGQPIQASFSPGTLDFGSGQKKTVGQCYVGVRADGPVHLKVAAELNGKAVSYVYPIRSVDPLTLKQQRITTGKGLRSSYVTPTFYNEAGADFEIDDVTFIIADMKRKI